MMKSSKYERTLLFRGFYSKKKVSDFLSVVNKMYRRRWNAATLTSVGKSTIRLKSTKLKLTRLDSLLLPLTKRCLVNLSTWNFAKQHKIIFYEGNGTSFPTPYISPLTLSNFYSILSPFLIFLHIFISLSLYLFCFSFSCFSPLSPYLFCFSPYLFCFSPLSPYLFCFSPYLFCFSPFSLSPSLLLSPLFLIPLHSPSFSHLLSLLIISFSQFFFLLSLTSFLSLTFLFCHFSNIQCPMMVQSHYITLSLRQMLDDPV